MRRDWAGSGQVGRGQARHGFLCNKKIVLRIKL